MAGSMAGQPLFTVEQFELIRRLRNSGVTKEQIQGAFEMLERLDRELGPIFSVPISLAATFPAMAAIQQVVPNALSPGAAVTLGVRAMNPQANLLAQAQAQAQAQVQAQVQAQAQAQAAAAAVIKQEAASAGQTRKRSIDALSNGDNHNHLIHNLTSNKHSFSNGNVGNASDDDDVENTDEFKEFIGKGDHICCEEIRNFIIQYNIKQQQVAALSGISQSYVSRYLKGDFHDMSERSRRIMQKWYITFRKNPAAIGPAAQAAMLNNSPVQIKKFISMDSNNADFVNYPKRERFVFRPTHLEVLERYFSDDSYPSQEKRDEIARVCNSVVEVPVAGMNTPGGLIQSLMRYKGGRQLGDRERVTSQIVANWFANKRKEVKKMAREEGVDLSQVPLRGRGRPARFISELTSMSGMGDHHSNSNHSDAPPVSTPSAFTMGPHSILTDPSTILGDSPDDHSLSIAVEMAAVNQAIIALSGQTPINIHATEKNHQHHHHHHHHNNNNTTTNNNNSNHDNNHEHDHSSGQQTPDPEPQNLSSSSPQQNGTKHPPFSSEANNNNNNNKAEQEEKSHSPPATGHGDADSNSSHSTSVVVQPLGEIVFPSVSAAS